MECLLRHVITDQVQKKVFVLSGVTHVQEGSLHFLSYRSLPRNAAAVHGLALRGVYPPRNSRLGYTPPRSSSSMGGYTPPCTNPVFHASPVCPQGLYALRGFVCPQGTRMPSSDLHALKGFVCPQGTCMPSRGLYALRGLGPQRPGPYGPMGQAQGAQGDHIWT